MAQVVKLRNGVRLIADPMPGFESAAIGVWADAGAMDESDAENGVAHLLEHMAFKGTGRRSAKDIAEAVENVGGHVNASTGYQRTGYYARILKDDAALAVDILCDILSDPKLDAEDLEKEKEVVVQEIGEAADAPDDVVGELLQAEAFGGQALGRAILGTPASVRAQSRESLRAFLRRLYTKDELVFAAAGGVDPDAIAREFEARFPGPGDRAAEARRAPPAYRGGAVHDARDIEQCHVSAAFPAVGFDHEDYFATSVFVEALGGGMASRLFQKIREERGLAYSVYAYPEFYRGAGLVGLYFGVDGANAEEAVALARGEIAAMARQVDDAEIARARTVLRAMRVMGQESPAGRIEVAANQLLSFGEVYSPEFIRSRLEAVSGDDIRRCAARALESGTPSLAVVGPTDFDKVKRAVAR
jgi:predicted Zn-dependent peptidase